jgi:predicted AAA+ superfamily ATPase
VQRALQKKLTLPLDASTSDYGNAFENWFINECFRINTYLELDYQFSYLRTKDDVEVDLIILKPDGSEILVEIKSADKIDDKKVRNLLHLKNDFPDAQFICASRVKRPQKIANIEILPAMDALKKIFKFK